MRAQRHRYAGRAAAPLRRRSRVVLGRGRARPGRALEPRPTTRVLDGSRGIAVAALVPRRPAELHRQLRRPARGCRARRQAGDRLGGRRRAVAHADLRGAGARGQPAGQRAEALGIGRRATGSASSCRCRRRRRSPRSPSSSIGAIYTPCFSGYGAGAVASRLSDCEAKVLITADGFYRRGQVVTMKETRRRGGGAVPVRRARDRVPAARTRRSRGRRDATSGGTRPSPVRATVPRRCRSRPITRA